MKRVALVACFATFLFSTPSIAGWVDDDITDVIKNVKDVKEEVIGSGKTRAVVNDLRKQLTELKDKGLILRESVEDLLIWLQQRQGPYRTFVGTAPRCGSATPCAQFREDLKDFFLETAAQRGNFPVFDKLGVGDGSRSAYIVDISPPIILFGLYEVMNRMPDWRDMPSRLQEIFDEIDDPNIFSISLDDEDDASAPATSASLSVAPASAASGETPTERFCRRRAGRLDKEIDPVRLNRIKLFVFFYRTSFGLIESLTSETIGGDAVGEGSDTVIPNPLKAQLKLVLSAFDIIAEAVKTFRTNVQVCRDQRRTIELQVAQCIELVEFVTPDKRDDVYEVVKSKVDGADDQGVPVAKSRKALRLAESFRGSGDYKSAYLKLCEAYQKVGG